MRGSISYKQPSTKRGEAQENVVAQRCARLPKSVVGPTLNGDPTAQ